MMRLICRDERGKCGEREMDTREGDKISLELIEVDIEGAVEAKGGSDRRYDLRDETVQVIEAGLGNAQLCLANIEYSFVIDLYKRFNTNEV